MELATSQKPHLASSWISHGVAILTSGCLVAEFLVMTQHASRNGRDQRRWAGPGSLLFLLLGHVRWCMPPRVFPPPPPPPPSSSSLSCYFARQRPICMLILGKIRRLLLLFPSSPSSSSSNLSATPTLPLFRVCFRNVSGHYDWNPSQTTSFLVIHASFSRLRGARFVSKTSRNVWRLPANELGWPLAFFFSFFFSFFFFFFF